MTASVPASETATDLEFEIDQTALIRQRVLQFGGKESDVQTLLNLADEYSRLTLQPVDAVLWIVIDCLSSGMSSQDIQTQLSVHREATK
jgi:hypothetical protein